MNSRERVLKALKRQGKPDRAPFEISWGAFTPPLMQTYRNQTGTLQNPDEYFDFDTRSINLNPTSKYTDFAKYYNEPIAKNVIVDEWGVGATKGSVAHFLKYDHHPLALCKTPNEINDYEWPDVDEDYRFEGLQHKVNEYKQRGYVVMGELYQTIFEMSWLLRGFETLLMDFYLNEDIANAICENLMRIRVRQAKKYAELGVDILRLGDDVSTQNGPLMSTDIYRKYLKDRTRKIISAAKEVNPDILIFLHCDGKVEDIAQEFIDVGIDILNPIQPECNNHDTIFNRYGDKIAFWGGIGTQSTMPFGTEEDVKRQVKEVQNTLGRNGALLLAPSHILEPEVPWENVLAFIDASRNSKY
jgi:uroporphyrinogen decarboxylase